MKITFLLAGLGVLASLASAIAQPVLRSEVAVVSDIVTVGDFYSEAGIVSRKPLFRSPDLGKSGTVNAEIVAKRARAAGLTEAGTNGLREVVVKRLSLAYNADRLKAVVAETLAGQDATLRTEDLDISFHRQPKTIHLPALTEEILRAEQVLWSRTDGRFDIVVRYPDGAGFGELAVTGIAREMVTIATLIQPLRRGAVIQPSDLTSLRLPRARVPARAVISHEEIAGLAARSTLRAQTPLTRADFERPVIVKRGAKVSLVFSLPGMKLTARGQAMDDAALGDVVDVMNLQSRRIVQATVLSRGQVRVEPASALIASLEDRTQ